MSKKILIIKHGALGDWILSTGAFQLIRQHYPDAQISLLTNSQYAPLARMSSWFNEILIDNRDGLLKTLHLLTTIRKKKFTHVFDLQRSQRTTLYYRLLKSRSLFWSGKIKGCTGYFTDQPEKHILDRIALQLIASNILIYPFPDISWLKENISQISLKKPYALIIPGCSQYRPQKKWTISGYLQMIEWLDQQHIQSILIGAEADRHVIEAILMANTRQFSLIAHFASLGALAELARGAKLTLGCDTGPMHIVALTGCPCVVLFCSKEGKVRNSGPIGSCVRTIEVEDLSVLNAVKVIACANEVMSNN